MEMPLFSQGTLLSPGKTDIILNQNLQNKKAIVMPYHGCITEDPYLSIRQGVHYDLQTLDIDNVLQIFFMLFKIDDSIREFLTLLHGFEISDTWKRQTGVQQGRLH
jgi:hypothetical protein